MTTKTMPNLRDLAGERVTIFRGGTEASIPAREIAARVEQALADPINYPPLESATVPGDRVTVAIDAELPELAEFVRGALAGLRKAGIEVSDVTFLFQQSALLTEEELHKLRQTMGSEAHFLVHDAENAEQLAMLGVTRDERPLRLNRALCDADLVIAIAKSRLPSRSAHPAGVLFPQFSEEENIARFHQPGSVSSDADRDKLNKEIAECDWLLGLGLALQVVVGPDEGVAEILCGTPEGTSEIAQKSVGDTWALPPDLSADLVISLLGSSSRGHTWRDFTHALSVAMQTVRPGGAVAICGHLAERPGRSLSKLKNVDDLAALETKLPRENSPDAWAALTLCQALQLGPVYLLSNLPASTVESLGMTPIGDEGELRHLIASYPSCVVVEDARHAESPTNNFSGQVR